MSGASLCLISPCGSDGLLNLVNNLYDPMLGKLGYLSLEVRIEGYSHLDVLTGVRISQGFNSLNEVRHLPSYSL